MRRSSRTWFLNDFMKGGAREKRPRPGVEKRMTIFFWKRKVTRISRMGHRVTGLFVLALGSLVLSFSDAVEAVSEPRGVRIVPWRARRDLNPRPFPGRVGGLVLQVKSFSLRVCCSTWLSCPTRPAIVSGLRAHGTRRRVGPGRISNKGYRF